MRHFWLVVAIAHFFMAAPIQAAQEHPDITITQENTMAFKIITWWNPNQPLRAFPRILAYGQSRVVADRFVTQEFLTTYGDYLTVQNQTSGDMEYIGSLVSNTTPTLQQPIYGNPAFSTNPSISSAMPDFEWQLPSNTGLTGFRWTRVTATDYGSPGGWAFAYNRGTRINLRFFENTFTGVAPYRKLVAYTSEITPDPSGTQWVHDEPDIAWHPGSSNVVAAWNVRTGTTNIMDQYYRVYDVNGNALMGSDAFATWKTLESQWRPLLAPMMHSPSPANMLISFTGNHKDSAFYTVLPAEAPFTLGSPPGRDVQMAPVIGSHRQVSQDAIELPNGYIFTVWNHVEGKSRIRWRVFDANHQPLGSYTELPRQLQFGKDEPRVKYCNGKIWIVYHEEWAGGQYNGVNVWATVLNYTDSPSFSITTATPEFCVHPVNMSGLQRKPEFILWGDRALVVFEHYPRGVINPTTAPTFTGGSVIAGRLFDLSGNALTPVTRISTDTSFNGAHNHMLRPDIEKSIDETRAVVCWTASAAGNGNIYSTGSNAKLWARVIDLTALP